MKPLLIVTAVVLSLLIGLYAAAPAIVAWALPSYLAQFGFTDVTIDLERPALGRLDIRSLALRRDHIEVAIVGMRIRYDLTGLGAGRLRELEVREVGVDIGESDAPPLLEVPPLWNLVPADRARVQRLRVSTESPQAGLAGRLDFDENQAAFDGTLESPELPTSLRAQLRLAREGRIDLALSTPAGVELIAIHGVPDERGRIDIGGHLALSGAPLALLGGLLGVEALEGRVSGSIAGAAPWPLSAEAPLRDVRVSGDLDVEIHGRLDASSRFDALGRVSVSARDSMLEGQVGQGGRFGIDRLAAGDVEIGGANVTLVEPVQWRVSDDGKLTASAMVEMSELPDVRSTSSRWTFGKDDALRVALEVETSLAAADPVAVLSARARIDATLAVTQEGTASPIGWVELEAGANATWSAGRPAFVVDQDATLILGGLVVPIDGFEVPAIELELKQALAVGVDPASGDTDVAATQLGWSMPEIGVEGQRLSIRRGLVDIEWVRRRSGALDSSLTVATRSDKDALPARIRVGLDADPRRGRFEIAAQGAITRPLLATQLSGWRSDYDLDRGTIDFAVAGSWAPENGASAVSATGHLALAGAAAHVGDFTFGGIGLALPIALAAGVTFGPGPVEVAVIDVGVELRDLAATIEATPARVLARDLGVGVLGGRVKTSVLDYPLTGGASEFRFDVEGLSLAQVLALEGEDIAGEGVLDGTLPVRVEGSAVTMTGGRIVARAPGGSIRYRGAVSSAARSTPGLGLALDALTDFTYTQLEADADYAADGELDLRVRLRGRNPTVEEGRPIHFNLNVSENVLTLLRTLRVSGEVTERVQQKFSR